MAVIDATGRNLNIQVVEHGGLSWYDVRHPTTADMEYLKEQFPFHELDLEDCRSRVQLPKLDEYPSYIFLVLHFPLFDQRMRLTRPSQVAIFAGESYVVTVHQGDLRPLTKLFHDVELHDEARQEAMGFGSGILLYRILDRLVDYCFPIVNKLIDNMDALEARVLDRRSKNLSRDLAYLWRDLIAYRRVVRPQIQVLAALEAKEFRFLELDTEVYFGDLDDHMRRIWEELEELKEVVEGLQDTHSSLTSQHTNQVMRVLTAFASIMLPLTVVTSFYGMNVQLPLGGAAWTYVVVLGGMVVLSAVLLAFFWKRDWL